MDIGLQFATSSLSPCLNIGVIMVDFFTIPVSLEQFIMLDRGTAISFKLGLIMLGFKKSGPALWVSLRLQLSSSSSSGDVGWAAKERERIPLFKRSMKQSHKGPTV